MKKKLFGIVIVGALYAFCGYAAEKMITNDDLERKYPPASPAVPEGYLLRLKKDKLEAECASLKQEVSQARQAVHDDNDPRPRNDRLIEYTRINTYYMKKCVPDSR